MEPPVRMIARDRLIRMLSRVVMSALAQKVGQISVLDVGCGNGYILREMINIGADPAQCVGIDHDPALIEEAKVKSPRGMTYQCLGLDALEKIDRKFDIILTLGIFAYFTNEQIKDLSVRLRNLLQPGGFLVSSNYDADWQKLENGQLRGLDLERDQIRSFNFAANELNTLLSNFKHLFRCPHYVGGHKLSQYGELLSHASKYSAFEVLLDSNALKPSAYVDFYAAA